jgi:hypothetical protein
VEVKRRDIDKSIIRWIFPSPTPSTPRL